MSMTVKEQKLAQQIKELLSKFAKDNGIFNIYLSGDIYQDVANEHCYVTLYNPPVDKDKK